MNPHRRRLLFAASALAVATRVRAATPLLPPPGAGGRVVVVGAGWGGLACARHLRALAPALEVVLLDPAAEFHSQALSNPWLVGREGGRLIRFDVAATARAYGYRFVPTAVAAVDRAARQVVTAAGVLGYDWLVLAAGIREDPAAWTGGDAEAARALAGYGGAVTNAAALPALKARLERFGGGELVMVLPPAPQRCPPAPYERAIHLAWWLRQRRLKARLTVVDPNAVMSGFTRSFRDYADTVRYLPNVEVRGVDPQRRMVVTEVEELPFDDAVIMPPQQAADLVWQAGLIGRDGDGRPTGWAAVDPLRLLAREDERVFVVGDAVGAVSRLFGHYPKTGHMAWQMGRLVAREIAARAAGGPLPTPVLPESVCLLRTGVEPEEMMRVETRYRLRGDGELQQTVTQTRIAQPQGEDQAWAGTIFSDVFGRPG